MGIKELFGNKLGGNVDLSNKRFNDIVAEGTTSILKELGGYGIKESKLMVDNIIVFTNCSGGTGASTVASNIAYVLGSQQFGMSVLMIDLNIVCPIQHIYFDKEDPSKKTEYDLVDYLTGQCQMGEATITSGNVSIMYSVNRSIADSINCEESMALDNFKLLLEKSRDLYDIVIIDCPMQVANGLCNIAMYTADKLYTVWDEGISSVLNTDRIMRQLGFTGIDSFAKMIVIMNKKTSVKYSKFPFEKLKLPLIETLPFSTDVVYSSLDASVYCESGKARNKNGGEFERGIMALARKIVLIGGKTSLSDITDDGYKREEEETKVENGEDSAKHIEDSVEEDETKEINLDGDE